MFRYLSVAGSKLLLQEPICGTPRIELGVWGPLFRSNVWGAVTVIGVPDIYVKIPFTCQPPTSLPTAPPRVRKVLPGPIGNSYVNEPTSLCGRLNGVTILSRLR